MLFKLDKKGPIDIGFNKLTGNAGILISGGCDSTILFYMVSKTIVEEDLDITLYPITAELTRRNYSIRHTTEIIEKVKELTGIKTLGRHLTFPIPNHTFNYRVKPYDSSAESAMKAHITDDYTRHYSTHYNLHTLFNGKTKNPPASVEHLQEGREVDRDDPEAAGELLISVGNNMRHPLRYSDKKDIAFLYKSLELTDSLLPLTRSCEGDDIETNYFKFTCGQCWWCKERAWAFNE